MQQYLPPSATWGVVAPLQRLDMWTRMEQQNLQHYFKYMQCSANPAMQHSNVETDR